MLKYTYVQIYTNTEIHPKLIQLNSKTFSEPTKTELDKFNNIQLIYINNINIWLN